MLKDKFESGYKKKRSKMISFFMWYTFVAITNMSEA